MSNMRTVLAMAITAIAMSACSVSSPPATEVTPAPSATSAAGTLDLPGFTEQNLLHHMIVGDSIEVAMAKRAADRSTNTAVKDFATMLVNDHGTHMQQLIALGTKENINRTPYAGDSSYAHMMKGMAELPDTSWAPTSDQSFVRHQIMHHAHELALLKSARPTARDNEFEKLIDATVPVLRRHLSQAQQVGLQIGVDTSTTMTGMMHHPPSR